MSVATPTADSHTHLIRRGRALEYLTLGWNLAEAVIAITAGVLAGSSALLGFGLDSVIESTSGAVLLWRLRAGPEGERRERLALKLVGVRRDFEVVCVGVDMRRLFLESSLQRDERGASGDLELVLEA